MTHDRDRSPAQEARAAAIEWWVVSRAGFSREERARFEAWRAADPAHAAAYADIERTYAHVRSVRRARRAQAPAKTRRRERLVAGAAVALAASLAIYVAIGPLSIMLRANVATGTGETRVVTLSDGSTVTLDARSAIALRFTEGERRVSLLEGEAWFEVVNDPARPFVVEAGGGTVTDLGTTFDVDIVDGGARVAVGEHSVAVASKGEMVIVEEGRQTSFAAQSPPAQPSPAPRSLAAWRRGSLVFEDRPLGEVLRALGRYRRGFVECATREICARPVTAVLPAGDPRQALREIELFLGLRSVHFTEMMVILYE
ncbi:MULTISPECIES: FecR family protein [Methylosinus]|uniref:Iron dicitrate transport regulator FecR n=1 Tax=Methylosinus trichosporium (strain ATCC 35070 / NCIMB 11131 / UNIQEM 75 / OB3b) TaxID=595536 RepID=A0A2D2CW29_METT3|nr:MULTISPECIES: FecR domain-containing protein [Methylosinus]ATQ66876.1 iron dicitrate transport regulator FecR [Methylosinus trichosporium OB3b]OBS54254.1 iron dicitrate transport regulator FecR [Methylosinus sp. 3S-1]